MSEVSFDFEVDCEKCETKEFFGAAGTCSEDKSTCECPSGFTGRDNWLIYPTCHINERFAYGIQIAMICSIVIGILASTICVIVLLKRWKLLRKKPSLDKSVETSNRFAASSSKELSFTKSRKISATKSKKQSSFVHIARTKRAEIKEWKLKRDTVLANFFFLCFSLCAFVYQFPFLTTINGERFTMRDGTPWNQIAFALALATIMSALYIMLLTWYDTLPDVKAFGNLLQMNRFFIMFPNFIRHTTFIMILFSIIYSFVGIVILPSTNESFYPTMALLINLVCLFYVGLFGILQWIVISSVMNSFRQAVESLKFMQYGAQDKYSLSRQKVLKEALLSSWVFRAIGTATMLYCVALGVAALFLHQKYQYFIFNLVCLGPYVCSVVFPIGILWKTNGGLKPLPLQYDISEQQPYDPQQDFPRTI